MGVLAYKEQTIDSIMHLCICAYAECLSCLVAKTFQVKVFVTIYFFILLVHYRKKQSQSGAIST